MSEANINVKFGNPDESVSIPSYCSIVAELTKQKITSHYDKYSKILKKYRLPLVVMQLPKQFEKLKYKIVEDILGNDVVNERLIANDRCYCMYESKTPEQVVIIRKLQKMLEQLTTLKSQAYVNIMLCDLSAKRDLLKDKKVEFGALLLENLQIEAKVSLDENFCKLLGELISKISPGFDQSPLMGFLQLFEDAGVDLEFDNPSILKEKTRADTFPDLIDYEEPGDIEENDKLIRQMLDCSDPVILYIHFGKLGYVKMTAEARIWAYLTCLA